MGYQKRCAVCVHSELSGQAETREQKVRKPVLSLLSSTLPRPREEAEQTGGRGGMLSFSYWGYTPQAWVFLQLPPVWRSTEIRGNP